MPDEKDVIYCTEVDDTGAIVRSSMITASNVRHMLQEASTKTVSGYSNEDLLRCAMVDYSGKMNFRKKSIDC